MQAGPGLGRRPEQRQLEGVRSLWEAICGQRAPKHQHTPTPPSEPADGAR